MKMSILSLSAAGTFFSLSVSIPHKQGLIGYRGGMAVVGVLAGCSVG